MNSQLGATKLMKETKEDGLGDRGVNVVIINEEISAQELKFSLCYL